jgi:hypothetical protein
VQVTLRGAVVDEEADAHQLFRPLVWEVAKEHAVDDGADADGGTDPHAEGGDHARREGWRAAQAADGEPRVADQVVDGGDATYLVRLLPEAPLPPKRRSAARRASDSFMPRRMFSSVSMSRWKANSSSSSAA